MSVFKKLWQLPVSGICRLKLLNVMGLAIILMMFSNLNFFGNNVYAADLQQIQVTGTIVDEGGLPLPGVNVVVKGTTIGVTTDMNGKFALTVPDRNATLVASFIGYITQEIPVAGRSVIDISLVSDALSLEEVVVVGYGTQKKVNVIGSVTTISTSEITASPTNTVSQSLGGRMPGLV
ncbi:MAG TPA: carboxypeptidase-like regulatory domain-containing protein, partial [Bacteroidales bacterium]|nr:carboxypeptidase-like regulatory domain-containing protein [Bacteroidales bacterium]